MSKHTKKGKSYKSISRHTKNKRLTKKYKSHKSKSHKSKSHKSKSYNKSSAITLYKNALGTRLLIMPNRNETATASIYFYFKVGSKNETPEIGGISHFVEHLIFKGSPKYPNYLDISKTFDANGISFNAYTSKDTTAYHYKFLSNKENIELICKITSDMIFNPLMREKDIKTERNVIVQEYNDDIDDIDEFIDDKIETCLLDGHPLGRPIIGTLKTIDSISREDIITYHKKYYRPDNLVIGFSGNMRDDYTNIIEKYFNEKSNKFLPISLQSQGVSQIIPFVDKHPESKIDCFPKDLKQDYIHIIFKTKGNLDPMKHQYKLIKNILGANMSSRLFVEIREKLGLVYSIKCSITNYEEVGYFDIYTQNETKDTVKCIQQIFKELVKFKDYGVKEKELNENKKNYCDLFKAGFDDIEYENEHFAAQLLLNTPLETIDERIEIINAITADELKNIAKDLFKFNKVHIITFGKVKKNTIQKILDKFI
jgi:predicted Zn-dependent peptidase